MNAKNILRELIMLGGLIIISAFCSAQAPGYMGKTLSISVTQHISPNYAYIYENYYDPLLAKYKSQYVNSVFSVGIDKVLNRRNSIGFYYSPVRYKVYFTDKIVFNEGSSYFDPVIQKISNYFDVGGFGAGLRYRIFTGSWIAPLGSFVQFDFMYSNYKIKNVGKKTDMYIEYRSKYNLRRYNSLIMSVTFGRSRIFFNRLILTRGIQIGFNGAAFHYINLSYGRYTSNYNLKSDVKFWYSQRFIYNLHLGIAILL